MTVLGHSRTSTVPPDIVRLQLMSGRNAAASSWSATSQKQTSCVI